MKDERGKRKEERGKRKEERGKRKQETGNRKQETGNRKQEAVAITAVSWFYFILYSLKHKTLFSHKSQTK